MYRKIVVLVFSLLLAGGSLLAQTQQQRLEKHLYYLASDSLQGRKAGSDDSRKAAAYIENEYRQMGLQPFGSTYRHYFIMQAASLRGGAMPINPDSADYYAEHDRTVYCNLVGIIEGSDPALKKEFIVVGGHYDHLGVRNGEVYNGADDNASGTAAVTEMARQLLARRGELKRSVIICAFDAEEMGLYGSKALSKEMMNLGLIGKVKMMMSIDMVGWLKQGKHLSFTGTGTLKDCADMIKEVAAQTGVPVSTRRFESSPFTATDTEPFASKGVPTLAVTTGLKSPYHKPGDDPELIDYPGLSQVTDMLTALTICMASDKQPMVSTGKVAAKHRDARKCFEISPVIGINSTQAYLPGSSLQPQSRTGFTGGVSTEWNLGKRFGAQVDVLYELARADYPNKDHLFGTGDTYCQQSVVVPVQLRALFGNSLASFNIGVGGFYGYRFGANLTDNEGVRVRTYPSQHQYGIVWSFELRMANLSYAFTNYYQLNELFTPAAGSIVPAPLKQTFAFTIGLYF